jgi:hypothetical protein
VLPLSVESLEFCQKQKRRAVYAARRLHSQNHTHPLLLLRGAISCSWCAKAVGSNSNNPWYHESIHKLNPFTTMLTKLKSDSKSRCPGFGGVASRIIFGLVVLLVFGLLSPTRSYGQANFVRPVTGGGAQTWCNANGECCVLFEFDAPVGSDKLTIDLGGGVTDNCFDWTCFTNQSTTNVTFSYSSVGHITINYLGGGTFPDPFFFYLCTNDGSGCIPSCMTTFHWHSYYHGASNGFGDDSLKTTCCAPPNPPCDGSCDLIWQSDWHTVCVSPGSFASSVTITFCPALPLCDQALPPSLGLSGFPACWTPTWTTNMFGCTVLTLSGPPFGGCDMHPCTVGCISFPTSCGNSGRITSMGLAFNPSTGNCLGSKYGVFKRSLPPPTNEKTSIENGTGQNFPNPVSSSSGFQTTIPFETNMAGSATITISNESGKKIASETEDILAAGHHFFYFTAKDLPSGTYFYTIEFPHGVVIVNKVMLVVK